MFYVHSTVFSPNESLPAEAVKPAHVLWFFKELPHIIVSRLTSPLLSVIWANHRPLIMAPH